MGAEGIRAAGKPNAVLFDVKYLLPAGSVDGRLVRADAESTMKILVTGSAGFIGSTLSQRLLERGDEVIGLDNLNDYYDVNLKRARWPVCNGRIPEFTEMCANLEDRPALTETFVRHRPRRVVNLAAQAGVRYSIQNPHAYVDSNLVGFVNLLEACRHHAVEHLVYASTSSVYGANTGCRSRCTITSIIRCRCMPPPRKPTS
jgi:nucleoside-diphosphate-sugar epimerase